MVALTAEVVDFSPQLVALAEGLDIQLSQILELERDEDLARNIVFLKLLDYGRLEASSVHPSSNLSWGPQRNLL